MIKVLRMESFGAVAYEESEDVSHLGHFGRSLYLKSPQEIVKFKDKALKVIDIGVRTWGYLSAPLSIEVEVTLSCPLRCRHCYSNAGTSDAALPSEIFKKLVDEASQMGVFTLDVIGGEPLVRRDLKELIGYAHKRDLSVTLNTNAVLANRDVVRELKEAGLSKVFISLDAHIPDVHDMIRGVKGAFQRTIIGLQNFASEDFTIILGFTATKLNYKLLSDYLDYAISLGADKVHVMRFIPIGRGELYRHELELSEEQVVEFLRNANRLKMRGIDVSFDCSFGVFNSLIPIEASATCPAGTVMATVLVDGTVVPCGHFRYHREFYAGNVRFESLMEIWKYSKVYEVFRREVLACKPCKAFTLCRGGCRAFSLLHGDKGVDPLACQYFLGK
ncbi:MAG: hypothetical protein DRJ33_03400 [Candidatus Methanomethylicota archaeon]|uniref:Radical SAM core domain-containing protein n=1 Tax=Thermoproteota archaeon TaxID=2056631 RepID=A0A497EZH5_9CREN|nr:MAG: hypothetical protein DRJ33_03400 [Candidatus Verstraetearchaeota archaeon]